MLERYDIADGKPVPGDGDPQIVFCMGVVGSFSLPPRPGIAPVSSYPLRGARPERDALPQETFVVTLLQLALDLLNRVQ
ncbi:hypothetical protein, partial [Nonomuraea zeae]